MALTDSLPREHSNQLCLQQSVHGLSALLPAQPPLASSSVRDLTHWYITCTASHTVPSTHLPPPSRVQGVGYCCIPSIILHNSRLLTAQMSRHSRSQIRFCGIIKRHKTQVRMLEQWKLPLLQAAVEWSKVPGLLAWSLGGSSNTKDAQTPDVVWLQPIHIQWHRQPGSGKRHKTI